MTAASAVRQNLHRMLVEGGQGLDARRRMVNLVEDNPEAREMAHAMPPVEDECADEPADESLQHRVLEPRQMKQRDARQQVEPEVVGREGDGDLHEVDENRASVPAGRVWQFPAGHDAFQRQKGRCNDHHGERGKGEVEH